MDESKAPSKPIKLDYLDDKLVLAFDNNEHTKLKIKSLQGVRHNKPLKRWEASISCYNQIVTALDNLVISTKVIQMFAKEAELQRKVKKLRSDEYYELEDYSPKVPLMSHQKKAFELHRILKGSGNWSEMGSGKTGSAICAIHWHLELGNIDKALVVCPKSVLRGWEEQIEFFSDLSYVSIVGTKRDKKLALDRNIYLINYEYTWRILDTLLDRSFNMVICDEAHRIKNPLAKQSKACYALGDASKYRIALTGTPVLNTSLDAFGIMRFVEPSTFGESFYSFRNKHFKNVGSENSPIKIYVPRKNSEEVISNALYTRALRFLKAQCLDLPEATHLPNRIVTLSPDQDKAYRNLQEELSAQITEDESITITHVLTLMLKLSQVTSGWIKNTETQEIIRFKSNPKLEELKTLVEEAGDQPAIVWAYYIEDMRQIINYFSRCKKCKEPVNKVPGENCPKCGTYIRYRCSEVQGSTKRRNAEIAIFRLSKKERAELRAKFIEEGRTKAEVRNELGDLIDGEESPQTNIIACQCVAASEGLNLQRATLAIFYSRNWSLKDWVQALARNHRKGQGKKVTYVSLVARMRNGENTVDQRIADALDKKVNLSKRVNKDELAQILVKDLKANSKAIAKLVKDASYSE